MKSFFRVSLTAFLCTISVACAGRKLRTDLPKNVSLTSILKDPSNTVTGTLFVFIIKSDCNWDQVAQFKLEPGTVEIGLPVGEKIALEFAFGATNFFSANRQVSQQELFIAKEGAKYNIEANYNKGMYFVEVKEIAAGQKQARLIERVDPGNCEQSK